MKKEFSSEAWFQSSRGQQLVGQEQECLKRAFGRLFGRNLLQVGDWAPNFMPDPPHWRTGVIGCKGDVQVICDLGALPLAASSVDAIVLAHSLETAPSAHRLLREVDAALSPRGQLLILGFNPLSWWGLRQKLLPWYPALPTQDRFISTGRIVDWLRLLDYEVVHCDRFGGSQWRFDGLQSVLRTFSPAYLIHARKRRIPVNPVQKPLWRQAPSDMETARLSSPRASARSTVVPFIHGADS